MKQKLTSIWLVALFSCLCSNVIADATEYAVHVGPNGYAPYSVVERSGTEIRYTGVMFDLLDLFETAHPEFTRTYILATRKRANIKMAMGEDIDLMFNSPLFVSDEILGHYQFTEPLFTTKDVVVTRKKGDVSYETAEDLHGKTVGAIRGYSYGKFDMLMKHGVIQDVRVDHHTQAIGMLDKGRIDAYFGNIFVSPHYIKQLGLDVDEFEFSDVPMYEFDFSFAVNKNKPEIFKKLNDFIGVVKSDGTLSELLKNYIN